MLNPVFGPASCVSPSAAAIFDLRQEPFEHRAEREHHWCRKRARDDSAKGAQYFTSFYSPNKTVVVTLDDPKGV